jgi:tyrosine-protein kinase Etk/Wzc
MRPVHDPDRPRPDPREFPLEPEVSPGLRLEPDAVPRTQRFLAAFRSQWRTYAAIVGAATLLAAGIALLLPSWFRAKSTLLPPSESSEQAGFGMLSGMIQSSALNHLGLTTTNTPSDVFAEILKSRLLSEAAINRFGYAKLYRKKGMDRTVKEFQRHLTVSVNAAGILDVAFEDRSAQRAADVTNFLVSELDRFNVDTYKTRGKRLRQFLEGRVSEVQGQLVAAEERLLEYERRNRVVSNTDPEAGKGVADILAQKFSLETQRAYVSSYSSPGSTELLNIDRQLQALNSEIGKLPEVKLEGARLVLDVEVQRKLLVLIQGQYEDARMQETRDTPTVTVLDAATVPELKVRPIRSLIVLGAAFAALLGCSAWTAASLARES